MRRSGSGSASPTDSRCRCCSVVIIIFVVVAVCMMTTTLFDGDSTRTFRLLLIICHAPMFYFPSLSLSSPASGAAYHPQVLTTGPSSPTTKRFLIGFLPALTANKGQNKHFVGAFVYALGRINEDLHKHGYHIDYLMVDNKADTAASLRGLTSLYFNGTIAFIGPEDTCAIEARLAAAWNKAMIAFVRIKLHVSDISVRSSGGRDPPPPLPSVETDIR